MAASYSVSRFSLLLPLLMLPALHSCCIIPCGCPPPKQCNESFIPIRFPFTNVDAPPDCGINVISCHEGLTQISLFNQNFSVRNISYPERRIDIVYPASFEKDLCRTFPSLSAQLGDKLFPSSSGLSTLQLTVFVCHEEDRTTNNEDKPDCGDGTSSHVSCKDSEDVHARLYLSRERPGTPQFDNCSAYRIPAGGLGPCPVRFEDMPNQAFSLPWKFDCTECEEREDGCDSGSCQCKDDSVKPKRCSGNQKRKIILGVVLGVISASVTAAICFLLFFCFRNRYSGRQSPLIALSFTHSGSPSRTSNQPNLETTSFYRRCRGVTIFCYEDLEKATGNFSPSNELGDGGFGIVYYGVLSDGREVAVKRLFEHNCNRVVQFMNEIEILSHIRHPNLVRLYGCTSRNSRGLLLVYEYIDNGTVGDHLNGSLAAERLLTWKLRLNIAVKTAEALAYLHQLKPPIIHRDVKTNNILIDKNFRVKVSDFGLSRLFPDDVTHVSTVPQGTPGYIDPQYHQCYQLTDKSDVYSFGVVLIELISSLPAVNIMRPTDKVNLANMAIEMIHKNALHDLVDSSIGFQSDYLVQKSVRAVAELAFSCLAYEREVRPAMTEVAETLRQIQAQVQKPENKKPSFEDLLKSCAFLKVLEHSSPNPATSKQVNQHAMPNSNV